MFVLLVKSVVVGRSVVSVCWRLIRISLRGLMMVCLLSGVVLGRL